jgi:membrane associated rhomboid family serine protease
MIPIRDTTQSKNYPVINTFLISVNVLFFFLQLMQGPAQTQFIITYGLVPARYSVPAIAAHFRLSQQILALITFMFLHGGFWHLLANMWSLYIFGDNVEDRLGSLRYLFFYLLCGWVSGLFHLFTNWHSQIPTIGASGAIAGVMGAYLLLYPRSKILTLIPIFFIPYFIEVPAFFFLGFWFLMQFLGAAGSRGQGGGIAWWAHVGGFVGGIILLKLFLQIPEMGMTSRVRTATSKGRTPRLQVIQTTSRLNEPHVYGNILVTPGEARAGAKKLVNVPWGIRSRIFRVIVPAGIKEGNLLRLAGMGKLTRRGDKGDLLLRVQIRA